MCGGRGGFTSHIAEGSPMVCLHHEDIKLVYSDTLGLLRTGSLANHPFWPLICRNRSPTIRFAHVGLRLRSSLPSTDHLGRTVQRSSILKHLETGISRCASPRRVSGLSKITMEGTVDLTRYQR